MAHYLDIHLLPDPEIGTHQVMSALYGKLHRALVASSLSSVAVCFPDQSKDLGPRLRLIGPATALDALMSRPWLQGVADHVQIGIPTAVPPTAVPRRLQRVQAKSSPERLRRRQMRRHGLTAEEAAERIPETARETVDLPFITLRSASTGQTFRLFFRLSAPLPAPVEGTFNSYGLSATATIPWF